MTEVSHGFNMILIDHWYDGIGAYSWHSMFYNTCTLASASIGLDIRHAIFIESQYRHSYQKGSGLDLF